MSIKLTISIIVKLVLLGLAAFERINVPLYLFIINPLLDLFLFKIFSEYFNKKWLIPCFITDVFVPFFGTLLNLIFFALFPVYRFIYDRQNKKDELDFDQEQFQTEIIYKKAKLQDKAHIDIETDLYGTFQIQPYLDIILGDDTDLKINSCIKLMEINTYESIIILKKALQDESYEVRYMANNALDKLEQQYTIEIEQHSEMISKHPNTPENYKLRGNSYLYLARSGLLDEALSNFFLEKALDDFTKVIHFSPNESYIYVKMAQVLTSLRRCDKVISISEKALDKKLTQDDWYKLLFYRAEAFYNLKDYVKVKETCALIKEKQDVIRYSKILIPLEWWGE
jgi:tetratricopeptide (TPR) repeat protein